MHIGSNSHVLGGRLGRECGKCGGRMEPGFLAHPSLEHSHQVAWHPGEPRAEQVSFLGIEVNRSWQVRLAPDLLEPVTQYRCTGCGYLESYAH